MKKNIVLIIVALLVVGGGSFYGGMVYGKQQAAAARAQQRRGTFAGGAGFGNFQGGRGGMGANGGFVSGTVLSKTDTSLTVQLTDGGSKIVLLTSSTPVSAMTQVPMSDLTVGSRVAVIGSADASGAVTAQSIQIRPATSTMR